MNLMANANLYENPSNEEVITAKTIDWLFNSLGVKRTPGEDLTEDIAEVSVELRKESQKPVYFLDASKRK